MMSKTSSVFVLASTAACLWLMSAHDEAKQREFNNAIFSMMERGEMEEGNYRIDADANIIKVERNVTENVDIERNIYPSVFLNHEGVLVDCYGNPVGKGSK